MMIVKRKKVANPAVKRRTKTNATKRRKLTAKQIKHFGTKRQKAALKASRTRKRAKISNPASRKRATTTKRKRNPAQLITLGFMNPHKTSKKRKRKTNPMATKKRRRRSTAKAAP